MENFIEISRIIEGALSGDKQRVIAYLEQLVKKLKQNGDASTAKIFEKYSKNLDPNGLGISADMNRSLPVDSESRLSLADTSFIPKGTVRVIMPRKINERVEEFLTYIHNSIKLHASGVGISPSMIMYGPPGVGKTELARFIASRLGLPLLTARTDSLISSYLGSTAKNLRLLFDHANSRPCVLFLDEFDAIAKLRDDQHELGELKRVVISLLQNIDTLNPNTVLLAATNHQHLLDPAVWRRFSFNIEFSMPTFLERKRLIKMFLGGYSPSKIDLDLLAEITIDLSGAALKQVCENAIRKAVLDRKKSVDENALLSSFLLIKLPNDFAFDINDERFILIFNKIFKGVISQSQMAKLFSTSEATISRRVNEQEGKNEPRK